MLARFGLAGRQLSARRAQQGGFLGRGLEEFFENGARLPTKRDQTGRAWMASELRQKSWEDLQKLWYILLKERNVLASQKEEQLRLGIDKQFFKTTARVVKCKKSMARIKTVLNERRLAWEAAERQAAEKQAAGTAAEPPKAGDRPE
ncbi:54S ribosomal protein L4 mitochondrial [Coemansia javaensis]|uniref:Large ribosomal subunit protein uL29m n=1 Tax=Coemansia javaensis TaxID=2761396 RepID=A0A9W8LIN8_9FUNG|nr:54S ribosomal protein L4 mitochondrial [Coemansia javaensis]